MKVTRSKGKSVRMISPKAAQYKFFWIGKENGLEGVCIFLAEKWVDEVVDTRRVSYRMIVIKLLVQGIIISVIPAHDPRMMISITSLSVVRQ